MVLALVVSLVDACHTSVEHLAALSLYVNSPNALPLSFISLPQVTEERDEYFKITKNLEAVQISLAMEIYIFFL